MNSYNENLHSAIVSSLQSLDVEEQNLKSQVNAAMFTLYHAEGATITAQQNLGAAKDTLRFKTVTQNQAVKDSNASVNLLNSATQGSQYVKQSTTNIAVAAANVQISANAIVRLASDIGSIYSILSAADFDSDIYFLAREAYQLMNETAYDAEVASQLAMEASTLTAEVSAPTVLDMAKATNTLMSSVLKITTTGFETATQDMAADNAALSAVRTTEKLDEGALEMVSIAYNATKSAYGLTNRELNLDLQVKTNDKNPLSFTVDFDLIKSPFPVENNDDPMYPVSQYYMMVVKEKKKQTFSISNAENILLLDNTEMISVVPPKTSHVSQVVNVYNSLEGNNLPAVTDSDNEEIKLGENYVVFVMAIYTDEYKRKINCYDDYLSAPSQVFTLTTKLESIPGKAIHVKPYQEKDLSDDERSLAEAFKHEQRHSADLTEDDTLADYTYVMTFETKENLNKAVEYRCMLLPFSPDVSDRLLTSDSLHFLVENEINKLEELASEFDPEIARLQGESYTNGLKLELLGTELDDLNTQLTAYSKNEASSTEETAAKQQSLKAEQKAVSAQLKELQKSHEAQTKQLAFLVSEKNKKSHNTAKIDMAKPGFLFNVPIAEQVYADSYTVAKQKKSTKDDNGSLQWTTFFGPDTTDNFGNKLNKKEKYLPVILSYSTAAAANETDFVNALSVIATTDYFTY